MLRRGRQFNLIFIAVLGFCIWAPHVSYAATPEETPNFGNFEVGIPTIGRPGTSIDTYVASNRGHALVYFAATIVRIITAIIVTIALMATVAGGYVYMTAGGSADRVRLAKTIIIASLTGVVLALASFMMLTTISPQFLPTEDPRLDIRP